MDKKAKFDLNMHTARLLISEPFFAALSRRINKIATTSIPTAGVRVNPDTSQFEMVYNPDFFVNLSDTCKAGVLKHEFYHLIFEHVTRRKPDSVAPMMWNFATDLAINSHLEGELPDTCLMPGEREFADYKKGLSAEAYLKKMQQDEQFSDGDKMNSEGEGSGQFDNHDGWAGDESDSTANDIAKERFKDYIKKAAKEATERASGWGTVPACVRRDIISRLQTHIDWRKVLRYFIKTSQRNNKRSTVRKINKRFPYIHSGKKILRQAQIAISIDQSGSVSDEMLQSFFGELNKLSKLASFTVIPFDTRVDPAMVYEWKKGENKKATRVMCGGTDFNAPTKYVNERGFDGHIVLTDLMAPKPKPSACQRMWLTTKYYASRPYFKTSERIIAMDLDS